MISFQGMGRFSLVVAFLTVILALAGCTVEFKPPLIPGQPVPGQLPENYQAPTQAAPEPAPAEETKAEPRRASKPQPKPKSKTVERKPRGEQTTAMFRHFNIRIMGTATSADYHGVNAEVCLMEEVKGKATRVSTDPWTIKADGHTVLPQPRPDLSRAGGFPRETWLNDEECAFGWLWFPAEGTKSFTIKYHNSLGDTARWDDTGTRIG